MKNLVEMIVRSLVDSPDEVQITETSGESIVILEINVSADDVGKVIGKEGRIANAIRTVVKAAAAKLDKKVTVEILTKKDKQDEKETNEWQNSEQKERKLF